MHTTEHVTVAMSKPRGYPKTALEITAKIFAQRGNGKGMQYLEAVMKAVESPVHWKEPFKAWYPEIDREWIKAAIIWYHGAQPLDNGYWVCSTGYAC